MKGVERSLKSESTHCDHPLVTSRLFEGEKLWMDDTLYPL